MMIKKSSTFIHLFFMSLFLVILTSCSTVVTLPNEQLTIAKIDGEIQNFNTMSKITGFYIDAYETVDFNADGGKYDIETYTITGELEDGKIISVLIDTLFSIKVKSINHVNSVKLKPNQFKIDFQKKPSKSFNPCWDFVKVKSSETKTDESNQTLIGVTEKNIKFEYNLSDLYNLKMRYKKVYNINYKKIALSAVEIYALAFGARDIFK